MNNNQYADGKKIYNRLNATNESLKVLENNEVITDGSWERFNASLNELATLFEEPYFTNLILFPVMDLDGHPYVMSGDFKRKIYESLSYLHLQILERTTISPQLPILTARGGTTNISQHTSVAVEFNQTLIQISGMLADSEAKFEKGTPERNYIEELKVALSATNSAYEIIALVISLAEKLSVGIASLHRIFSK